MAPRGGDAGSRALAGRMGERTTDLAGGTPTSGRAAGAQRRARPGSLSTSKPRWISATESGGIENTGTPLGSRRDSRSQATCVDFKQ